MMTREQFAQVLDELVPQDAVRRAYKLRHVLIDGQWRPEWLLSDSGQWTMEIPEGYEAASAAQWVEDGRPGGRDDA